ncbi:hypothetical protein [Atlantibacter hermannii]|uniref:hypothetical protein n=1 Tax=Atlantibacter hermannii TaxID=565 RepID=UPI00289EA3B6|nr:hypothetical protein [Atlantibacter hermannii]
MTINERVSNLTLDAAIDHATERADALSGPCAAQHAQLAAWLLELQQYRAAAEPVAWTCQGALVDVQCGSTVMMGPEGKVGFEPLYAAPQVTSVPAVQAGQDYRDIVERVAVVLHGSVTDLALLPVTAQSVMDKVAATAVSDAEPVAWLWSHRKHQGEVTLVRPEDDKRSEAAHWSGWICQPLYATPQAVKEQKEKK